MIVFVKCRRSESKCFCWSYVFADCNGCVLLRTQEKIEKQYCMSLRTAMIVFVKCRRSESNVSAGRMSLRTAMVVSCYEHKRKSKSNIVCLCGLQWLCLLSVGDLKVNVSKGRMSLRTAATETKRKSTRNIVCLCGLQWLCLLSVGDLKVNVSKGRMSLWIAMIVFVKCRRSESTCFFRSYVFADCGYGDKEKI